MKIEKIQEIIEKAKSVALALKENPDESEILSREALRLFFQNNKLSVYLLPETPEDLKRKWSPILNDFSNPPLFSEVLLRFPKSSLNIKEINYEEDPEFLTLKLLAEESKVEKDNIVFESKPTTIDSIIYLSSVEIEELPEFQEKISFPREEKIILITPEDKTLSEKIFEIIESIKTEILTNENNLFNLLLAALLLETNNFKKKVSESSLNLAHRLLSLGANKKLVDEIINKDFSLSFAQILGRTLSRTRPNQSLQSNWAFISSQDFEKAGVKNIGVFLIRRIAEEVKEIVPKQPIFVILWENGENMVQALITTERNKERQAGPYKNFSEAEIKIRQILKEIL